MKTQLSEFTRGTLAWLIQRVIEDIASQPGKQLGTTQSYAWKALQRMPIAQKKAATLEREDFIEFVKWRREQATRFGTKVGPATAKSSLVNINVVVNYACSTWKDCKDLIPVIGHLKAAGKFLSKRGLIAKAQRRTRRVSDEEVVALLDYYKRHKGRVLRMEEVIAFCLASGRRRGEVCRITWGDIDFENKVYKVRDLKHPTRKKGNDKSFILFPVIEQVILRQPRLRPDDPNERIFPFVPESITQSFITAKKAIAAETGDPTILTLRLHDHRAEAISKWLFVMSAEDVRVCVSGHNNTKILTDHYDRRSGLEVMQKKYTHLMQQPAA